MSARSMNKVMLIGNLTRDPELRYTAQGTPVASFGLATNRSWTDSDGQRQEDAEFHRIVAWSKLAEICEQLLFKGRKVFIEGRIQSRKWSDKEGQERETFEIVAENMMVLDDRRKEGSFGESETWSDPARDKASASSAGDDGSSGQASKKGASSKSAKSKKGSSKKTSDDVEGEEAPQGNESVNLDDIPF